jgi:hypothetical protein
VGAWRARPAAASEGAKGRPLALVDVVRPVPICCFVLGVIGSCIEKIGQQITWAAASAKLKLYGKLI